jgi:hypothetical protein
MTRKTCPQCNSENTIIPIEETNIEKPQETTNKMIQKLSEEFNIVETKVDYICENCGVGLKEENLQP